MIFLSISTKKNIVFKLGIIYEEKNNNKQRSTSNDKALKMKCLKLESFDKHKISNFELLFFCALFTFNKSK